jgi:hypothetical protein
VRDEKNAQGLMGNKKQRGTWKAHRFRADALI